MKIKIDINESSAKKRLFNRETKLFLATEVAKSLEKYVPFRTGLLSQNIDIKEDGITYKMPYSKKMYYCDNFNFYKGNHPLATSRWDKVGMVREKDKIIASLERFLKTK